MYKQDTVYFSKTHEWVKWLSEDLVIIGLSDFAQKEMGDIVFVNINEGECKLNESIGDAESVKAVSDIISPVTGNISKVNEEIFDEPGLINSKPLETWLCEIENVSEVDELMSEEDYLKFIGG